ncbi:type IV secretory system conjugative DNA transfer family protein [bacterium]|nr:type IV secretory system conjugative DNA transfer family protein [bacterium]
MAVVKNQPITYESKLDGTKISAYDYDEYVNKYNQDIVVFKEIYLKHREQYHPENVDGTAMIFDLSFNATKFVICLCVAIFCFALLYWVLSKNLKAQNLMADTSDINMYHNDQHIALPEEIQRNYDWFPDVGAHSGVQVSSMISHMALTNKGLKTVQLAKRADKDIKDKDGNIEYYKGAIIEDDDGNPVTSTVPMIDEEFMEALYDASGAPKDKDVRKKYDTTKIPYNPDGSNRDKLGKYDTVADLINEDWEFPLYEPQRPGGAYIVDTAPVNTMVLAITRAGKGQTVIEPTLDMWMREKRPNNMVVNDPKGELLVKNYVRATVRGLQVVQFNLINAMKTDIYNPLALAADAAREGDNTKCAMYVENIADVFFPLDGGEDPLWPNAANNAFKRAAYGLIDFYLEEEKAMRRMAERTHLNEKVLEQRLDEMWGKVTLYNCYQLFVQLSSKKMKNPAVEFSNQAKAGKFNDLSDAEYQAELEKVKNKSKLWEDKPEADLLTLYFSATDMLPRNSMRTLVANANNALKAIGGAEKMLSSVYGIAITAMSFFTDPTISTLTSGTPNQNVDLGGMSFPRRMGVRFNSDYINKYHFVGQQAVWNAYEDIDFKNCLGKDFYHEDMVTREGWARYYFDGKFKNDIAYVKLEIKNPSNGSLIRTFYFEFKKNYQTSLDGRVYMKDPVLEEKIVKNGLLTELRKFKKKDGSIVFKKSKTTFKQQKILDFKNAEKIDVNVNAIISTMCRYSEKPKMVFLVTPPHLILGNLDKCQEICYN